MNLVDSSGWLEYFAGGTNADFFEEAILNTSELLVSTINIYEVYKKILTENNETSAMEAVSYMNQGNTVNVDLSISLQAAELSSRLKLPMADSLIYVTAVLNDATIFTQDADMKDLPGVKYVKK